MPTTALQTDVVARNRERFDWAEDACRALVEAAAPFHAMDDHTLWNAMFGPNVPRSWMVLSYGDCPACGGEVPMYNWQIDALARPWKLACPHCGALFPTNDFEAFHRSGLNRHHEFDMRLADRSLLFNADHPDPDDPLHMFGVDDGHGFGLGANRYRFVGTYMIYGQWKKVVVAGIVALAAAYVVTGDASYAHKAGVLLDRVADLYPRFDFGKQAWLYEHRGSAGYVSTWHDACEEHREMALAYGYIRPALQEDQSLADFVAGQAVRHQLRRYVRSPADVCAHIEDNLLRDALRHKHRIHSNYPRREIALVTTLRTLGTPDDHAEADRIVDHTLERATAVDGVTGEKGLDGYSCYTIRGLADFLARENREKPGYLEDMLARHPSLGKTWRFFIDTWCIGRFYPRIGDTSSFAEQADVYCGVVFNDTPTLKPSTWRFLWDLYKATGDVAYVQAAVHANGGTTDGLPHDLFCDNPQAVQAEAQAVIDEHGMTPSLTHVNFEQWHLAILRGGDGDDARATWLSYDTGGAHAHANALNLGLFGKGVDLLPDLGYPPVHFGGWNSERSHWYRNAASHQLVVVDGVLPSWRHWREPIAGKTTLWAPGERASAVRADASATIKPTDEPDADRRYERTVIDVTIDAADHYLVDVFRVRGGQRHTRFLLSGFSTLTMQGVTLHDTADFGHGAQLRGFQRDDNPAPGWSADFALDDRDDIPYRDIHLRLTEHTTSAFAGRCEAWIVKGSYDSIEQDWIPRVYAERTAEQHGPADGSPLASTFVGVIDSFAGDARLSRSRRIALASDGHVAVEVDHVDGTRDLVIARDPEVDGPITVDAWRVTCDADVVVVRRGPDGGRRYAMVAHGSATIDGQTLAADNTAGFVEITGN